LLRFFGWYLNAFTVDLGFFVVFAVFWRYFRVFLDFGYVWVWYNTVFGVFCAASYFCGGFSVLWGFVKLVGV